MRRDNIMYLVTPQDSQSPGRQQLAELFTDLVNDMKPGLERFQTIRRLDSHGYGITYSRQIGN
jgi:hypothetical protein